MAELITEIVSPKAIEQIELLNQKLLQSDSNFLAALDSANKYAKALENSKGIKEVRINTEKLASANEKINTSVKETVKLGKEKEAVQKKIIAAQKALALSQSKEGKALAAINEEKIKQNRLNKQEAKNQLGLIGEYQKLAKRLTDAKLAYKNLAASGKEFANEAKKQKAIIDSLDSRIKSIDKTVGESQRNVGNYTSAWQGLKSTFLSYFTIGAAVTGVISNITEGLKDARVIEGVRVAFDKLNDPNLLSNLQESTKNTVNNLDLMTAAVQSKNLGVPIQELGGLFAFAQKRALETGESVDFLVDSIVKGIGRKSPLILDNLGISAIDLKKNLDGVAIGQATTGQVAAAVGKIIKKSQEEAGGAIESNQERLLRAKARFENIRTELGTKLLPVLTNVTALVTAIGAALLQIPFPVVIAAVSLFTINLIAQNKELIKSKILLLQDATASLSLAASKRSLAASLKVVTGGFKALFRVMLANPIIAIIAGVAALAGWLIKLASRNESVKKSFAQVRAAMQSISKAFQPIIGLVGKLVSVFARVLGPVIEKLTNKVLVPLANKVLPKIALAFRVAGGGISSFVSVFGFAYDQIKTIAGGFVDTLKGVFTIDRDLIQRGISAQVGGFKNLFNGLGKAAKEGFKEGFKIDEEIASPTESKGSGINAGAISAGQLSSGAKTLLKNGSAAPTKKNGPITFPTISELFGSDGLDKQEKELADSYNDAISNFLDKVLDDPANKKKAREVMEKIVFGDQLSEGDALKLRTEIKLAVKIDASKRADAQKAIEEFVNDLSKVAEKAQEFLTHATDIGGILTARTLERLGAEKQAITDKYDLEAELIKANYDTVEQRDKDLAKLAIKRQAEEKRIRQEELVARQRQARFEKAANVASIISNTALAIIKFLAKPGGVKGAALSVGAGITGGIQLAKALATPIPQYAKGVKSKPTDGPAIVGEVGSELVKEPGKKPYFTPSTSTLTYLKKGTEVIPNNQLMQYMYSTPTAAAYVSSSTDKDSLNLEETNDKLDKLIKVTDRKNLSVNIYGSAGFDSYKNSNRR